MRNFSDILVEKHMLSMDNIGLETSILKQADGSGKFTLGLTSVLASVDGPAQVNSGIYYFKCLKHLNFFSVSCFVNFELFFSFCYI